LAKRVAAEYGKAACDSNSEQGIDRRQRIVKVPVVVQNPCQPGDLDQVFADHLHEEVLHLAILGERTMRPDVPAVVTEHLGTRQPTHLDKALDDGSAGAVRSGLVCRSEARRSAASDDNVVHLPPALAVLRIPDTVQVRQPPKLALIFPRTVMIVLSARR